VLGTLPEGEAPGPVFRTRLDRARALAAADPGLQVAVLGGVTRPGAPPEGVVGTRYLREAGLCPRRMVAETRSRHTLENLREFRAALPAGEIDPRPVLLVTSRTHLARALRMAAGLGLAALPCAAEGPGGLRGAWRRLPAEAFLLHWYVVGSRFARLTRSRRMLARIS
jgi:uncharacterized SAM-binding protein YcdF (DUF218 family)